MNTPITDAAANESIVKVYETSKLLELDRAALMDALESFLNPSHPSRSNHTLLAVALANARANFPTT